MNTQRHISLSEIHSSLPGDTNLTFLLHAYKDINDKRAYQRYNS